MKISTADTIALHMRAVNTGMVAAIFTLLIFLAISGCAVCETHPTACKIGAGVAAVVVAGVAVNYAAGHASSTTSSRTINTGAPAQPPAPPCGGCST